LARYIAASAAPSRSRRLRRRPGRRDADARGDEHLLAADLQRRRQAVDHLLRHQRGVVGRGEVAEDHRELVAADARHGVAGAHHRLQAARRSLQQLVAAGVAQGVVDLLEVDRGR
jgi:hypothetical protein